MTKQEGLALCNVNKEETYKLHELLDMCDYSFTKPSVFCGFAGNICVFANIKLDDVGGWVIKRIFLED